MVWRRLLGKDKAPSDPPEVTVRDGARTATHGGPQPRPAAPRPSIRLDDATRERRRSELFRRREAVLFDIEQGELALRPENPWRERIELLGDALATVDADREALASRPAAPTFPLPPLSITGIEATAGDQVSVRFVIGGERFAFAEEVDWDQRGGAVVRGDLRQQEGDPSRLLPPETPSGLRDALADHLAASLTVFAVDLRDRALAGETLPDAPTLADLARPCPECGGWRDWHGRCLACARRELERQSLLAEASRLEAERRREEEERHRWADRLPIARRRLADIDADLAALDA